jgi:hypothetical protein
MTDETLQTSNFGWTPKGLELTLKSVLHEIKSAAEVKDCKLGEIHYRGEIVYNPTFVAHHALIYQVSIVHGNPIVNMRDNSRCPASARMLGFRLYRELFDPNIKHIDFRPSFTDITIGTENKFLGKSIYINLNRSSPERFKKFSSKTFIELTKKIEAERYYVTIKSINDLFKNLVPAVHELLSSKYKSNNIHLVNDGKDNYVLNEEVQSAWLKKQQVSK